MSADPLPASALFTLHAEAFGQVMRVWFMGELSQRTAPECRADLHEPLAGREPIVLVDIGGLSTVDASGVDALRAIKRDLESRGRHLLLSSVSNGMAQALSDDGATCAFDILDGGVRSYSRCGVCDGSLPPGLHLCPHCGAVL